MPHLLRLIRMLIPFVLILVGLAYLVGTLQTDDPPPLLYERSINRTDVDIALLDLRTGVSLHLTHHDARDEAPAWRGNDPAAITFQSDRGDDRAYYTMTLREQRPQRIAATDAATTDLVWSPSGDAAAHLWLGPDGGFITLLHGDGTAQVLTADSNIYTPPVWSPDGARMAYIDIGTSGIPDVYVVGREGGASARLTFRASASSPTWHPDGKTIAYTVRGEDNRRVVYVVDVTTGDQRQVFEGAGTWLVQWSPTGEHIALIVGAGEANDLHLAGYDPNSNREEEFDTRQLSEGLVISDIVWSEAGNWLVLSARPTAESWYAFADGTTRGAFGVRYRLWNAWRRVETRIGRPPDLTQDDLYVYRMGWDAPRRVTFTTAIEAAPSWGPR
ncbi:MAG: hypothetical protein AAF125_13400 [Chloroflexota bacterium]